MSEKTKSTAPLTGPRVFLDYDQKALDDAYDQAAYASNGQQMSARNARNSELMRERLGEPERVAYGPADIERVDIYRTRRANAPVNVFLHGGAWRSGRSRDFGYAAEMLMNAGAHYVVVDFNNAPEVGGDIMVMADQVKRALVWVYRNAASFGGDTSRIYVTGRSSGSHLGGVLATTDWTKEPGLPRDPVRGYVLANGMYDLRGPRLSKRSSYVKFTDEIEQRLSPMRHIDQVNAPIVLLYGSLETPEFKRQTREFADALQKAGKQVKLVYVEHYNHYELGESIGNPYGPVGREMLEQMGLAPKPPQ